ncbi:hypothetical protein CMI42_04720 [Candidatus Pacearchaeota archaeon]|nr:hypothetical protein [Candidatus Pacearchaeota archaeon]|tara:strand:+ start:149 stop:712 length:564 start_codon:yes stop_codon:yes gene_type:complete
MKEKINCVIVHGCPDNEEDLSYNKHWIPWIERELTSRNISVETPSMPKPWIPNYEDFKKEFEKYNVNENSVLVGHSCGCAFLVRWLGEFEKRVKKLILVAPWKLPYREDGSDKEFYSYEISSKVKDQVGEIIIFTSDNEVKDGKKSSEILHKALGGKRIELENKGHYTLGDMGKEEFPELLETILSS